MKLQCKQLGTDFELLEGSNVIGRRPDCVIVLPSDAAGVSRRHAECFVENNAVKIRDLGSRNNTRLNELELVPEDWYTVNVGDRIHICEYSFLLYDGKLPRREHGSVVIDKDSSSLSDDSSSIAMSSVAIQALQPSREVNQLHALVRVTNALRGILETNYVLAEAAKILHEIFPGVERAVIGFADQDTITPRWWHLRNPDENSEIRISSTIVRKVVDTREALLAADAKQQFDDAVSIPALSIQSVMCAPLFGEGDMVIGFIYVDTIGASRFLDNDLQILAAIATQVSLAIGYSRMHESVVHDRVYLHDLEQARIVQQRYLPDEEPTFPGYEVSFFYRAARHIGGDYFDSISLNNGKHLFVLGDVEGKGAAAALTMVRLASETRASAELASSPAELLTRLNQRITEKWVTYAAIQLDPVSHSLMVANAAQELPIQLKADGSILELTEESRGLPFSVLEDEEYQQDELSIEAGESILLFSDGFPDAESSSGERLGKARLIEEIRKASAGEEDVCAHLCHFVDDFRGDKEQFDDMCMISVKRVE